MKTIQPIPPTLAPFFQEFDLERLNLKRAAPLIIERTLQYGDRAEIRWLFTEYTRAQIINWYRNYAKERLPQPHLTFWRIVLDI